MRVSFVIIISFIMLAVGGCQHRSTPELTIIATTQTMALTQTPPTRTITSAPTIATTSAELAPTRDVIETLPIPTQLSTPTPSPDVLASMIQLLNSGATIADLENKFEPTLGSVLQQDLDRDGNEEIAIAYISSVSDNTATGAFAILKRIDSIYEPVFNTGFASYVSSLTIVATEDFGGDGYPQVVLHSMIATSTLFDSVDLFGWDGKEWRWTSLGTLHGRTEVVVLHDSENAIKLIHIGELYNARFTDPTVRGMVVYAWNSEALASDITYYCFDDPADSPVSDCDHIMSREEALAIERAD